MSTLMSFVIFILVLFLYIHITAHYKKSEDLEIYEADYNTAKQLQEICDLKQPVLFDIKPIKPDVLDRNSLEQIEHASEKSSFEIHIKDTTDIRNSPEFAGESILLPFRSGYGLIETDQKSRFFSENNTEFTANVVPDINEMDDFLKPQFTMQKKYDILIGSDKSYTSCRYHTEYEKFLLVKNGKIQVKMTPWKSRKHLYVEHDYLNYEFRSPVDIWNTQDKYKNDIDNVKFLEFEVMEGFVLYVPPFWFYSIRFLNGNSKPAIVESYTYNSIMNIASNIPQWAMYYLQQFNTNTKVLPKKNIDENIFIKNPESDIEKDNIEKVEKENRPIENKNELSDFVM